MPSPQDLSTSLLLFTNCDRSRLSDNFSLYLGGTRMSNNEIIALKPGRDLDLEAALKIMDYMWITHLLRFSAEMAVKWIGTQKELDEAGGVFIPVKPTDFQELKYRENFDENVPAYSTTLTHAQSIIEKMAALGFTHHSEEVTADSQTTYTVSFKSSAKPVTKISAASQAEAIVKAALLAIS